MKQLIAACVFAVAIATTPAHASGPTEPVMEADTIMTEAEQDSSKVDLLMMSLWMGLFFAVSGGAF